MRHYWIAVIVVMGLGVTTAGQAQVQETFPQIAKAEKDTDGKAAAKVRRAEERAAAAAKHAEQRAKHAEKQAEAAAKRAEQAAKRAAKQAGHDAGVTDGERGDLPPGLAKRDELPKGLNDQEKTPEGWSKGEKHGWRERFFGWMKDEETDTDTE